MNVVIGVELYGDFVQLHLPSRWADMPDWLVPYYRRGTTIKNDLALLNADLAADKPRAIEFYRRFVAWRLSN